MCVSAFGNQIVMTSESVEAEAVGAVASRWLCL